MGLGLLGFCLGFCLGCCLGSLGTHCESSRGHKGDILEIGCAAKSQRELKPLNGKRNLARLNERAFDTDANMQMLLDAKGSG